MKKLHAILEILMKYPVVDYIWAEHDVIGFLFDEEIISKKDMERLIELGVFYDDGYNAFVIYV